MNIYYQYIFWRDVLEKHSHFPTVLYFIIICFTNPYTFYLHDKKAYIIFRPNSLPDKNDMNAHNNLSVPNRLLVKMHRDPTPKMPTS